MYDTPAIRQGSAEGCSWQGALSATPVLGTDHRIHLYRFPWLPLLSSVLQYSSLAQPRHTAMEAFEDDNPFESEPERLPSDGSSSQVNVSGVSSPDLSTQPTRVSSAPTSPSKRNTFPSLGSHRQPQAYKSDFCCGRDHWLHSGEDVEILVSIPIVYLPQPLPEMFLNLLYFAVDHGCPQDLRELVVSIYHLRHSSGGKQTITCGITIV